MFVALFALSILKGLRMPSQWAMTHYLFTYQWGFMKRALWGEILRRVLGEWTASYFCLAAVGIGALLVLIALLWRACSGLPRSPRTTRFLLVFAASPAIAYMAHLVGYLEEFAYIAVLVGLLLRRRWSLQVAWLLVAAAALPLVHEASILWAGCLSGLVLATATAPPRRRLIALALVGIVWAASTAAVLASGRVTRQHLEAIRSDRARMAHFHMRDDAFDTLRTPLAEQMHGMQMWWSYPDRQIEFVSSVLVFGPAAVFLGAIAIGRGRALDGGRAIGIVAIVLTCGAIAGPLVLHAIAIDQHRWNALATFNAGLAALILTQAAPDTGERRRASRGLALALVVAIWSVAADPVFFDDYEPMHPPFVTQLKWLFSAIQNPNRDRWIPRN